MGHTYGSWLRGDERGWRARHHREHVDGDYKNPPPEEEYDELHKKSRRFMKRPPVALKWEQRVIACKAFGEKLLALNVELIDCCVTARHFHVLARFTALGQSPGMAVPGLCPENALQDGRDPVPRHFIGLRRNIRRSNFAPPVLESAAASGSCDAIASRSRTATINCAL